MGREWPLGSEVKRSAIAGGAMLYDRSRAGNLRPAWFEQDFWRGRNSVDGEAPGRGKTLFVHSGSKRLALRHYRRGGFIARLSQDRYVWAGEVKTRPFVEWALTYHLHRAGLPVPVPVAARYLRSRYTYSGDLITERLEGTRSLASCLGQSALSLDAWIAVGRCIRRFHVLGVCHADLNAHNILLTENVDIYIIDFDRGTLRKPGLWCDANLVRLRRSVEKITESLPADRFTEDDWHSLLDGYHDSR
ncbi:MAG TPA: 3-deoxy-D-manno-octulosonic acid kinase [Steroidobacteraceae bacterium]